MSSLQSREVSAIQRFVMYISHYGATASVHYNYLWLFAIQGCLFRECSAVPLHFTFRQACNDQLRYYNTFPHDVLATPVANAYHTRDMNTCHRTMHGTLHTGYIGNKRAHKLSLPSQSIDHTYTISY